MSRKFETSRRNVPRSNKEERAGYCKVCGAYYNDLADHARSSQHGPYPPIQYPQLESIFDYCDLDNMGCLKKSLRIVKCPPSEIFEKPSLELPVVTMNGHVPQSNINKAVLYNGFFSPERGNYGRNDEDTIFVNNESSDESEIELKHRTKQAKKSQLRRSKISRKRLSVEEKLIEDNKSYYRVEVLNSKLRSTEYFINQKQLESRVGNGLSNSSCSDEVDTNREDHQPLLEGKEQKKEPVVVRFKKVRKSQLSVLSDEAESFMFGDSARREAKKIVYSSPVESSDSRDSEASSSTDEELPKMRKMVMDRNEESPVTEGVDSDPLLSPPTLTCNHDSISESEEDIIDDFSKSTITLDSINFSFENPPKHEPWIETYKRQEIGKEEFHYPYHHEYPKLLLPYEYPVNDRLKMLSGKKGPGFGRRRGRKNLDDGKARKSPRCHPSTMAVMSNFLRRPLRECTKTLDFSYEEESRSSLPDTVETSSSTSEFHVSSFISDGNELPVDPNGDVFAVALARVACGETSSLHIDPGPCLPVNPSILDESPSDIGICLRPGLTVPLETIIEQHSSDTSWMKYMDYSNDFQQETVFDNYQQTNSEIEDKTYTKGSPYCWPELPLRRRRKRMKKEEEYPPKVVPPVMIKCEPCEIKLEPMSAKILEQFSIKNEKKVSMKRKSVIVKEEPQSEELAAPTVTKRGRGRPRKKNPSVDFESPSAESSSLLQQPTKSYLKKSTIPRFSFIQRSYVNQIV